MVTILMAVVAGGFGSSFTIPLFKWLSARGKATADGIKEEKTQERVGIQEYIRILTQRVDLLEKRLDKKEILHREEIIRKDKVIDILQAQVSKLSVEVEIQASTILSLQTQINANQS